MTEKEFFNKIKETEYSRRIFDFVGDRSLDRENNWPNYINIVETANVLEFLFSNYVKNNNDFHWETLAHYCVQDAQDRQEKWEQTF